MGLAGRPAVSPRDLSALSLPVRQECSDPWDHLAEPFPAEVVQKPLMSSVVICPSHVKKSYTDHWQPYSPRSVDLIQQDLDCVVCGDTRSFEFVIISGRARSVQVARMSRGTYSHSLADS
jgi:hypothetical protein